MAEMASMKSRALVCALALGCVASAGPRHLAESPPIASAPSFTAASERLPAGLALPAVEAAQQIIGLVCADIDSDGDLDVIVNEGSLDLAVWVNDGTGRLTRKHAARSSGWQTEAPSPSFDVRPSAVSALNDLPSLGGDLRLRTIALARSQPPSQAAHTAIAQSAIGSSIPRAPPAVA